MIMKSLFKIISIKNISKDYHTSNYILKKIIEIVPPLGESITEGSIATWNKNEGDRVDIDDVIAIVETDKVTVDIKSTHAGILTKKIAIDTVIVGNPLYEIDTMDSNETSTKASIQSSTSTIQPIHTTESSNDINHSRTHIPLIKFIGKREHIKKDILKKSNTPTSTIKLNKPPIHNHIIKESGTGVLFTTLKDKGLYGRPKLSLKEIEAIESGGATL